MCVCVVCDVVVCTNRCREILNAFSHQDEDDMKRTCVCLYLSLCVYVCVYVSFVYVFVRVYV